MRIGYARVSSTGQELNGQIEKLTAAGCEKVFSEKVSGKTAHRAQLTGVLDYVREGDQLVVTKLDRLARSTYHLTQIGKHLEEKGVDLVVLDQPFDTSTPHGQLMFNVLACIAEFENEIRRERQVEGIARAKQKGVKFGRPSVLDDDDVEQLRMRRKNGEPVRKLCKAFRISPSTLYRLTGPLKKDEI